MGGRLMRGRLMRVRLMRGNVRLMRCRFIEG